MFDLSRIMHAGTSGMVAEIQKQLEQCIDDLLKDALNPNFFTMLQQMLRSMGVNLTQLPGMVGKQPGIDTYKILGLDKTATDEEVKTRYRELLRKLHPDTAGMEGTAFLLQIVMMAYEMIKKERNWK